MQDRQLKNREETGKICYTEVLMQRFPGIFQGRVDHYTWHASEEYLNLEREALKRNGKNEILENTVPGLLHMVCEFLKTFVK